MKESNNSFAFDFERKFDELTASEWIKQHWTDTFYFNVTYLLVIFSLKKFMNRRAAKELKIVLVIWNILLATFSTIGTLRTLPNLVGSLRDYGIHHAICDRSFAATDEVTRVWMYLMALSKIFELLDTVFVVLRKRPLIFLHWYHHMATLSYSWFSYGQLISTSRWFVSINFLIHSIMYSYYALQCLNFKSPKLISMIITSLQILQMIICFLVNIYAWWQIQQGVKCGTTISNVVVSSVMYLSYFILFFRFFQKAYLRKRAKPVLSNTKKIE